MTDRLLATLEALKPETWRVHGNGFLQIPLDQFNRIHIWDSRYFKGLGQHNATIHNHVWSFSSTVLQGSLRWAEYRLSDESRGGWPVTNLVFDIYLVGEAGQPGMGPLLRRSVILQSQVHETKRGETYTFEAGKYHDTPHWNNCTTLLTKEDGFDAFTRPSVLCPQGEQPTDAFDFVQPSPARLVEGALQAIRSHGNEDVVINAIEERLC